MRQGAKRGMKNEPALGLRSRLVLGTALATSAFVGGYRGYVRRAFADCTGAGGTYTCSGVTTTTQTLPISPPPGVLTVTTDPGFSIDTTGTGGDAFTLTGTGGLTFTDNNQSTITGYIDGISADNSGSGALSITVTGTVTGTNLTDPYIGGVGIIARNYGTDLTINAVDVNGAGDGITARNLGTGALSISATGTVTSAAYTGIYARNLGTSLTINAVDVSGEVGITAQNYGTGALSITTTGTVTGTTNSGIAATNNATTTDLTINSVNVSGVVGINAHHYGSGAVLISTTGTVTGTTGAGIYALNEAGTDLTINTANVNGADYGIYAVQYGSGATLISATGTVTGTSANGIYVNHHGTDLTINVANVTGGANGINAHNDGTGALSITSTGTVTGSSVDGIYALNNSGTDLTINAVNVNGYREGIWAVNHGTGALSITATGAVTGTTLLGASGDPVGIFARNYGTDLTINAVDVSGAGSGFAVRNYGTGALSITTTGTVTATSSSAGDGTGIFARNFSSGTDLTINTVNVNSLGSGISARNYGSGAMSITSTGIVTSVNQIGINARNYGTNLTIQAATVNGGTYGIQALHYGSGALAITTTGAVRGTSADGIDAYTCSCGTDLTIVAAAVSGGGAGIYAEHHGTGALSITVSGAVTGNGGAGIYAFNGSAAASSTTAVNVGSGAAVSGTPVGVALVSDTGRAASLVNAGSIQGPTGVLAATTGPVTITNNGSITGTGGTAIDLTNTSGANTVNQQGGTITGNVNGGSGGDAIGVSGGTITGNITGGGGADKVTVSGGTITGGIDAESVTLTGGTIGGDITGLGPDTLIINGSAVPLVLRNGIVFSGTNANAFITNEDLAQGGTFTQVFTGFNSVTSDNSTLGFGTGAIGIGTLTLVNGSTLYINGNVNMPGGTANIVGSTIQMIDGATDDVFTLGGIALNGATLGFDVNQQTLQADQIVAGTFSALGTNTILVNILGTPQFSQPTQIQIIQTGSPITGNFVIVGVPGTQSALFNYQLIFGPGGGLFVVATPDNVGVALAAQNAVDVGAANVMIDALYGINNDAIMHDLGLANGAAVASLSDTLDVFASGQFAHTEHDGFDVSFGGITGGGPSFGVDEFSAAISLDFNAAKAFDFDKQYGLNLGVFGGYASADVDIGGFQTFTSSGEAENRSGMFGGYGLFRQNLTYALVSAIAFIGNTDITNDILGTTGDYDTEGYGVTASAGHIFVLDDKLRFDLRGGILGVTFTGGDYTDSGGNQFGESRISFGALKLEPGIYADYPLENGMTLSPYARVELQQRFGYTNKASIDGVEVHFDDADFSAAAYGGFNLKMSERSTLSSEVRGKWSADSTTIAAKLGLKVAF